MVELYYVKIEALPEKLESRFPPEQCYRFAKMKEKQRLHSMYAHLLLRVLLCAGKTENTVRLSLGEHGKPYLPGGPHFSLAHSEGAVAAAISHTGEIGVDLERLRPVPLRVMEKYFTASERAYVNAAVSAPVQELRFFEIWTKKEACLKQTGQGITLPLAGLDTLSPPWADRLYTTTCERYVLSCCTAAADIRLHWLTAGELLRQAMALPSFSDIEC